MTPELASWPWNGLGQLVGEDVDARRGEARVLAIGHRRGAGMAGPALQRQLEPSDRLDAGDGTWSPALAFQHRALLDMRARDRREPSGSPAAPGR